MSRSLCCLAAIGLLVSSTSAAPLLTETFDDDPVANGRATLAGDASRFTHNIDGTLTGEYNTLEPTAQLRWALGSTLTQDTSFSFDVGFRINSADFFADPNGFAQIAFGLLNAATTGLDRAGGPGPDINDPPIDPDTFDLATFDYFPNLSPFFRTPNTQPTLVETDDPTAASIFELFHVPTSREAAQDQPGEVDLPRDELLTAHYGYDAASRRVTLSVDDGSGTPLVLNADSETGVGGLDGDTATVQFDLDPDAVFAVDTFGLLLWQDGWASGSPSVRADVVFDSFTVVPEPASAAVCALGALALWRRRGRA